MIKAIIILVIIAAIFGKSDNNSRKSPYASYKKTKKYNRPTLTKKEIKQIKKTIRRQQEEAELDMFATIEAFMDD